MINMDRRGILRGMGVMGAMAVLPGCSQGEPQAQARFFERIGKPIGLQLYALVGQDPVADPAALFAQVKAMGYGEVELPNLLGQEPEALRQASDDAGLPFASMHVQAAPRGPNAGLTFQSDPDELAELANTLGIDQLIIPFPVVPDSFVPQEGEDFASSMSRAFADAGEDHWRAMAENFNTYGQQMKDRGITLGYHNHNLEFAPLGDTTGWDILLGATDPELVKIQLDLGWVAQAGRDPVAELRALAGRTVSVHVKDVAADSGESFYFGMSPTEVGSGTLDWASILPAAEEAGVVHYFVEQEPPFAMPRAEAMAVSLAYLQGLEA